ncbi:MAG: hypothetical protein K2X87_26620 [Gemmataceae bacterium]|nr:hypothetical protein [Gemmataceae bacterium]
MSDEPDGSGRLRFAFVPRGGDGLPPEYLVTVTGHGAGTSFSWIKEPEGAELRQELEKVAKGRVAARRAWLDRLAALVAEVKAWADEFGWVTKVVDKKMEDQEVGNYKAPALVAQDGPVRLFLEPVARAAPGAEGLVDLYLMPAYDDVASLYHYGGRWNVHYLFGGRPDVANIREAQAEPLTKDILRRVFDEMRSHAG